MKQSASEGKEGDKGSRALVTEIGKDVTGESKPEEVTQEASIASTADNHLNELE